MTASAARTLAREVVSAVRERSAYSHEVFDAHARRAGLAPTEVPLAARLTYGTLQTQGTLDEALDRYLGGRRLEPRVRDALRIATYELLFLRTPERAAVHQGVELVRAVRPQASGLANAILRRISDDAETFPWGDPHTDDVALARLYGHPQWLAELLVGELDRPAAESVMSANNEPAPLFVALNPFAGSAVDALHALEADGVSPQPCAITDCFKLDEGARAVHGAALRDGLVVACDAAAQLVPRFLRARPRERILEVGSGRGTKTLLLQASASRLGGLAEIFALDVHPFKARLLSERLMRLGVDGVTPLTGDGCDLGAVAGLPPAGSFDAVLIDAPCSGLGTLRRHPEKRWRLTPADIEAMSSLGGRLLQEAASLVRRGGFVVYSTCTVTRRENAAVIESFLAGKHGSDWHVDPLADDVPAQWRGYVTKEGYFSSLPESGGPDGHFAARLLKS